MGLDVTRRERNNWIAHAQAGGTVLVNGEPARLVGWTWQRSTPTGPRGSNTARVQYHRGGQTVSVPHKAVSLP